MSAVPHDVDMPPTPEQRAAAYVRPEIAARAAYVVQHAEGMIKLDAMENPYALPEPLRQQLARALADVPMHRYPDGGAARVHGALREAYAIDDDLGLVLGNGSDELIQIITSTLARPGAVVASPDPSFVMYRTNADFAALRFVGVDLAADFSLDMPAWRRVIARERPALVFLAYPNNPTGNLFAEDHVVEIIRTTPGLVVVDEAYHAFAGRSFVDRVREFPNLVILRTLSKLGMAGLRIGYAIGPQAWTREFDKVRPPYNLNVLTQTAVPILLQARDVLEQQARAIRDERARLSARLATLRGVRVFPSDANFVVAQVPDGPAWFNALKAAGILVKNLHGWHPRVANCLRITVGTPDEMDRLMNALTLIA